MHANEVHSLRADQMVRMIVNYTKRQKGGLIEPLSNKGIEWTD